MNWLLVILAILVMAIIFNTVVWSLFIWHAAFAKRNHHWLDRLLNFAEKWTS